MKITIFAAALVAAVAGVFSSCSLATTTLTIGTVNNSDMTRMQGLSIYFEKAHPDIKLRWVVLQEDALRQRLRRDIASGSGEFDVMTVGMYETPIWGRNGWIVPMKNLPAAYDVNDIFPSIRAGLSVDKTLYALPFYGESSMTYYRKDLFKAHGLTMPERPTWDQIEDFARKLNDPEHNQYGICLRGKPGWGENMALVSTMANAFGAQWFNMQWQPEFTGAAWKKTLNFYVNLLDQYGPPDAASKGFNENLALFGDGKCAMWVDATVGGSFVENPKQSKVVGKVGFALAPKEVTSKGAGWLWSWALAIPSSSDAKKAAKEFITWATSKDYIKLVAKVDGINNVPPGTRESTYANPAYLKAAPFAAMTLKSMLAVDPNDSTLKPSPYKGVQFVGIPEFQAIGRQVGLLVTGAVTNLMPVKQALLMAQKVTERDMKRAGYYSR